MAGGITMEDWYKSCLKCSISCWERVEVFLYHVFFLCGQSLEKGWYSSSKKERYQTGGTHLCKLYKVYICKAIRDTPPPKMVRYSTSMFGT